MHLYAINKNYSTFNAILPQHPGEGSVLAVTGGLSYHAAPALRAHYLHHFRARHVFGGRLARTQRVAIGKMAQLGLMNALAGAGEAYSIRVNAISPVAATRMFFSPVVSGELLPEQVAPGVAFLASSQCNFSGVVLRASNGRFATVRWQRSAGVDFGEADISPEEIAQQWSRIAE